MLCAFSFLFAQAYMFYPGCYSWSCLCISGGIAPTAMSAADNEEIDDESLFSEVEEVPDIDLTQRLKTITKYFDKEPFHPHPSDIPNGSQSGWRNALSSFGAGFSHSFMYNSRRYELAMPTLRAMYKDAYAHRLGQQRLEEEPYDVGEGRAAYLFWYSLTGSEITLPVQILNGLKSCVRNGGFERVYLLLYQDITNLPPGVTVIAASEYLPEDYFHRVLRCGAAEETHTLVWLADYLRLRACAATTHDSSAFVDLDIFWLRPLSSASLYQGHGFATHSVNRVSRENSDMKKRLNKLSQEYSIHPRDFMKILPPFVFPRNSCLAACCVVDVGLRLEDVLQHGVMKKKGAFGYDHIMEIVRKQINNHGLRRACFPTIAFAIVPYYAWDKPGLVAGDPQQGWHPKALDNPEVIGCINFQTSSNRQTGPGNRELESPTGTFWYWLQQYSEGFRMPTHRVRAKRAVTAAGSSCDARAATVADIHVKLGLVAAIDAPKNLFRFVMPSSHKVQL